MKNVTAVGLFALYIRVEMYFFPPERTLLPEGREK
jgi:hypothetical protein